MIHGARSRVEAPQRFGAGAERSLTASCDSVCLREDAGLAAIARNPVQVVAYREGSNPASHCLTIAWRSVSCVTLATQDLRC